MGYLKLNNNLMSIHDRAGFNSPKAFHIICSSSYRCESLAQKGDVTSELTQAASRVSVPTLKLSTNIFFTLKFAQNIHR